MARSPTTATPTSLSLSVLDDMPSALTGLLASVELPDEDEQAWYLSDEYMSAPTLRSKRAAAELASGTKVMQVSQYWGASNHSSHSFCHAHTIRDDARR